MLVHASGTCIFIYMRWWCVWSAIVIVLIQLPGSSECEIAYVRCCCARATRCAKSIINKWKEYISEFFQINHSHISHSLRYFPFRMRLFYAWSIIRLVWIIRKHSPNHDWESKIIYDSTAFSRFSSHMTIDQQRNFNSIFLLFYDMNGNCFLGFSPCKIFGSARAD